MKDLSGVQEKIQDQVENRFQKEKMIVQALVEQQDGQDVMNQDGQDDDDDDGGQDVSRAIVDEVEHILAKFCISCEASSSLDTIDITLMMKAIPQKVTSELQVSKFYQFNFSTTQDSLTAAQNSEQVQAFEYYDQLNSKRVQNIRKCILDQRDNLLCVQNIMTCIKEQVEKQENTIAEIELIWKKFEKTELERKRKKQEEDAANAEAFRKSDARKSKKGEKRKTTKK